MSARHPNLAYLLHPWPSDPSDATGTRSCGFLVGPSPSSTVEWRGWSLISPTPADCRAGPEWRLPRSASADGRSRSPSRGRRATWSIPPWSTPRVTRSTTKDVFPFRISPSPSPGRGVRWSPATTGMVVPSRSRAPDSWRGASNTRPTIWTDGSSSTASIARHDAACWRPCGSGTSKKPCLALAAGGPEPPACGRCPRTRGSPTTRPRGRRTGHVPIARGGGGELLGGARCGVGQADVTTAGALTVSKLLRARVGPDPHDLPPGPFGIEVRNGERRTGLAPDGCRASILPGDGRGVVEASGLGVRTPGPCVRPVSAAPGVGAHDAFRRDLTPVGELLEGLDVPFRLPRVPAVGAAGEDLGDPVHQAIL
jgi:hypothetical protein